MNAKEIGRFMILALTAIGALISQPACAQNYWLHPQEGRCITLEASKINFDGGADLDFLTSVWFLSLHSQIKPAFALIAEIPFSNFGTKGGDGENMLGNPLIGFRYLVDDRGPVFNVGVRLPLAPDDKWNAMFVGIYGAFDRFEAFLPDVASVCLSGGLIYENPHGMLFKCALGPSLMIPTEGENTESELYFDYNGEIWYQGEKTSFGFGLSGRLWFTEEGLDLGQRTVHQVGLAGNFTFGIVRPGFHIHYPLDKSLGDFIDMVYGLNITLMMK